MIEQIFYPVWGNAVLDRMLNLRRKTSEPRIDEWREWEADGEEAK
jgi:hypothetical protein